MPVARTTIRSYTGLVKILLTLTASVITLSSFADSQHITSEQLLNIKLPEVVLESAKPIKEGTKPGYLEVKGIIGQNIRFELLLPDAWNNRFTMGGGGGFVGTVQNATRESVKKGYATVGTDTGHQAKGPGISATWALDNLEAKVNFGYLAVHRTAEVAKALVRTYYGKDPDKSYFLGCSRGGGQAMMEAQRFPEDFDGIVAGAPAFNWTGIAASMISIAKALYPDPAVLDTNVLSKEALETLQKAILEQCDESDGLKDGMLLNPAAAKFDLSKVKGLSEEQKRAVQAIYDGARNGDKKIYPGFAPAAECDPGQWIAWITGPVPAMLKEKQPDLTFGFGTQIFKYLIFNQPDFDYSKYDFTNFDQDTRLAASFLNATDPDLKRLKARNGKLIIWHGWADPALPAQGTVDYYREVTAHDPAAKDYCRLFMVPGCLHCGGGPGASEIDWLSVIVDWTEHGKAPDHLIASKRENGKVVLTRPLLPYPGTVKYAGAGDPNKAESFTPANE
jgi:hypothetical protein